MRAPDRNRAVTGGPAASDEVVTPKGVRPRSRSGIRAASKLGTPKRGPARLRKAAPLFFDLMEAAPFAAFVKDAEGRYLYANPYLLATMGRHMGPDWLGKTDAQMWPPDAAALMHTHDKAAIRGPGPQVFSRVMPRADGPHTVLLTQFALPAGGSGAALGGIGVDITEYAKKGAERDRLAAAVEQATESVMITDLDAIITYVNPAFERVSGYRSDEVLGKNPRLLSSGLQTPWFYEAMWASLTNGLPWVSDFVNRRKDGSFFAEEAIITPIRDASGAITSYVAVRRDVTLERALEERSARLVRERSLIVETMKGLRAGDNPEETAQAICRQVAGLTGILAVQIAIFEADGIARTIGAVVKGQPDPPLHRMPAERSLELRERGAKGPWIEPWGDRPEHPYNLLVKGLGIGTFAYTPVRHHQELIGLLIVNAEVGGRETGIAEVMPALAEFADLAGALIGHDMTQWVDLERGRAHVSDIIDRGAFEPVFQPIVDLVDDTIVGYEALTRFADGANPEDVFAEAARVGLGLALEIATLQAALTASKTLPPSAWLNLNASPDLVLAAEPLRSLLRGGRRMVIELTEHTAIADYPAFRVAVAALGPKVELAVDDAGSGFSSLRHVVELHPAFVKLDRSLVVALDTDTARQAMIVGLMHFARTTGCRLIAEGIETDGELNMLRSMGIHLGQGYRLGRPEAATQTILSPASAGALVARRNAPGARKSERPWSVA